MTEEDESDSQHRPLPAHLRAPEVEPWERLPRESDREWALFSTYRLTAYANGDVVNGTYTARHLGEFAKWAALSEGYMYQLASRWNWNERCAAYDRHVDRAKTRASMLAIDRMREDHERDFVYLRQLAHESLARTLDEHRSGRLHLKPAELMALYKFLQDSERLHHGEATSRSESKSLNVSVSLRGAPAEVREWYRAQALAAQAGTGP